MELDPESEQIRDVYAHYGLAMYLAQNLERSLAMALAVEGSSDLMTSWDYDAKRGENFQCTFAILVSKFAALANNELSELVKVLGKARDKRDGLAHNCFWNTAIAFNSRGGGSDMLADLQRVKEEFELLDETLAELVNERLERRGYSLALLEANAHTALTEMLSGTRKLRDPEVVPNPVEIVSAYEWRSDPTRPGWIVLIDKNGRPLVPGERGLCFGPTSVPCGCVTVPMSLGGALPAIVKPRPKMTSAWNYGISLANGYVLRVSAEQGNNRKNFRVWGQSPRGKTQATSASQ